MTTITAADNISQVQLYGNNTSSCGYCGSRSGRASYGCVATTMSASMYQNMIDCMYILMYRDFVHLFIYSHVCLICKGGWRRSGDYIYKPDLLTACCKQYTIRLDTTQYKRNKKQRQVWNKFQRYLNDDLHTDMNTETSDTTDTPNTTISPYEAIETLIKQAIQQLIQTDTALSILQTYVDTINKQIKVYVNKHVKQTDDTKSYLSTNATLITYNSLRTHTTDIPYTIDELCNKLVAQCQHSNNNDITFETSTNGYINIVTSTIHIPQQRKRSISRNKQSHNSNNTNKQPKHKFTITHHPAQYTDETFALYKRYQIAVHHDAPSSVTKSQYTNFLCDSPLYVDPHTDNSKTKYGSYHTHYRIDGKLIAVGVIDILPLCLSSVYVYYDPELSDTLSLGTLTALCEIEYVNTTLVKEYPALKYYYMGFYIHNCVKMRYKAQYEPTEILCLKQYTWHLYDSVKYALDQTDTVLFSDVVVKHKTHMTDDFKYVFDAKSMKQLYTTRLSQAQQWLPELKVVYNNKLYHIAQIPSILTHKQFVREMQEYLVRITEPIAHNVAIALN